MKNEDRVPEEVHNTDPLPALAAALPLVADRLRGLSVDMSTARVEWYCDRDGWQQVVTVEAVGTKGQMK